MKGELEIVVALEVSQRDLLDVAGACGGWRFLSTTTAALVIDTTTIYDMNNELFFDIIL